MLQVWDIKAAQSLNRLSSSGCVIHVFLIVILRFCFSFVCAQFKTLGSVLWIWIDIAQANPNILEVFHCGCLPVKQILVTKTYFAGTSFTVIWIAMQSKTMQSQYWTLFFWKIIILCKQKSKILKVKTKSEMLLSSHVDEGLIVNNVLLALVLSLNKTYSFILYYMFCLICKSSGTNNKDFLSCAAFW